MRARPVLIGVLWYVAGAAALLAAWLIVVRGGAGLLEVIDGRDLAVLIVGALVTALIALTLQHFGLGKPTAASRGKGARPASEGARSSREDEPWGSLGGILGAAVALAVSPPAAAEADLVDPARGTFDQLLIDGDRDDVAVVFDHDHAHKRIGGARPCGRCHHLNSPGDEATSCSECHRSMDGPTDIFDHDFHAEKLGGNARCSSCHPEDARDEARTRETTTPCTECHGRGAEEPLDVMVADGSTIAMGLGTAPSYTQAMHALCVECHREAGELERTRCPTCHRSGDVEEGEHE